MTTLKDMTGNRFGRLVCIERGDSASRVAAWLCQCDCGNTKVVRGPELRGGRTKSCGCFRAERMTKMNTTHGMRYTSEYMAWKSMRDRCALPQHHAWKNYGGRGIRVCKRWQYSFENFYTDVGPKPTPAHTLDRINNDGNYTKANVRWATWQEQALNRKMHKRDSSGRWSGWNRN